VGAFKHLAAAVPALKDEGGRNPSQNSRSARRVVVAALERILRAT
jgi:hypothetical protein